MFYSNVCVYNVCFHCVNERVDENASWSNLSRRLRKLSRLCGAAAGICCLIAPSIFFQFLHCVPFGHLVPFAIDVPILQWLHSYRYKNCMSSIYADYRPRPRKEALTQIILHNLPYITLLNLYATNQRRTFTPLAWEGDQR